MTRLELLKSALKESKTAYKNDPHLIPFEWIIKQLQYLINVESGVEQDDSRLRKIKIDCITARELNGYDDRRLIYSLTSTSRIVDEMIQDRGEK